MNTVTGVLLKSATYRVNFSYNGRSSYIWVAAERDGDGLCFFIDAGITPEEYTVVAPILQAIADTTGHADFQTFVWQETGEENYVLRKEKAPLTIADYLQRWDND